MNFTKEDILKILEEVVDPEIPTVSLVDLGVITNIETKDDFVKITMTPTFSGCPAMDYMKQDVIDTLDRYGVENKEVEITFDEPWSSNKITEKGLEGLKKHGLALPQKYISPEEINYIQYATCPHCDGDNTELRSPFGPTLCRAFHFCNDCNMMFEQFKAL